MGRIKTSDVLKELGIDAEVKCYEGVEPEITDVKFTDVLPQLSRGGPRAREVASARLYKHQLEALSELQKGNNVILISGTGSGKTEAWLLYALSRKKKTLVIYPTLALSADQIRRIEDYSRAVGSSEYVIKIDRPSINALSGGDISARICKANIVITNPAFLMSDLKRAANRPSSSYLLPFLRVTDLVVIDELDFYGSKGATLLISMIELINDYIKQGNLQVAILTATLGNAGELASILEKITKRKTVIVKGKPFRIRNCTYIVLGKNVESIRNMVLDYCRKYNNLDSWVREVAEDPHLFRKYVLDIVDYLKSKGIKLPSPYVDPVEILKYYLRDDYVTVVFTPSIKTAERLMRRLRDSVEDRLKNLVAVHHHLVPKNVREKIEEYARAKPPKIKVIITVRTLLQGIDIGNIARIVHYGLPVEVREFWQREGRKGRRRELGEAETVIIPISSWDRAIGSNGLKGVEEYSMIPLEKVYVLASNKYAILFKALFKVIADIPLRDEELALLKELGLVRLAKTLSGERLELSDRGLEVWRNLNFYEFGPPYGVRRLLISDGVSEAEPISRRDLVERYQPGAIDYSSEAIVVKIERGTLYEVPSSKIEAVRLEYPFVNEALGHYVAIKGRWGEKADLVGDVIKGKLNSVVEVNVRVPKSGFGEYVEKPYYVKWIIESSKRVKIAKLGNTIIPYYDEEVIMLDVNTYGTYRDFTYGYYYRVDPATDPVELRIGAAAVRLILRLSPNYAISFRELNISVEHLLAPTCTVAIWEPEASGILSILKWEDILSELEKFKDPPTLWFPLIKLIDRDAASVIASREMGWGDVLLCARRFINGIAGLEKVDLSGMGIYLPKPSVSHGIISLEAASASAPGSKWVVALSFFDGERKETFVDVGNRYLLREVDKFIESVLSRALDEDFTVVSSTNLSNLIYRRTTRLLHDHLVSEGRVVNPYAELKKYLNIELLDIEELGKILNVRVPRIQASKLSKEKLQEYVESYAILTYKAYLIVNELRKKGVRRKAEEGVI